MRIEILIYCYGAVCLSMIVFNFLCIFVFRGRERRAMKQSRNFSERINKQISLIRDGEKLSDREYRYLAGRLSRVGNLLAFDRSLEDRFSEQPETAELYIRELHRVFLQLSSVYLKKEGIQSAFFLHMVNKYKVSRLKCYDALTGVIVEYFKKPSVYCSLNAMETMYVSGRCENVIKGLKILSKKEDYFHSKLIINGLSSFAGDRDKLRVALIEEFDSLSLTFQTAIIDYFAAFGGGCDEFVLNILWDEGADDELRYAAIRYFGRHHCEDAYAILCAFASEKDTSAWVYASQSVSALAGYGGTDTVDILKEALSSSNWYVRYNAAVSLDRLGVSYNDLSDIINGGDRYAREIVTYHSEHKSLAERQVAVT